MSAWNKEQVFGHLIYFLQGFPLFFLNLTIVAAVLVHRPIRRRNTCLILALVAANDAFSGLGFIVGGATRLYLTFTNGTQQQVTSLHCLFRASSLFFFPIQHTYGLLMTAVSVDRLLSVYMPLRHGGWGTGYVYTFLAVTHLPLAPAFAYLAHTHSANLSKTSSPLCLPGDYFPSGYYKLVNAQWILLLILSGVIYLVVLCKVNRSNQPGQHAQSVLRALKQQRKLTRSLGLSCLATMCLLVLPIVGLLVLQRLQMDAAFIQAYQVAVRGPLSCLSMIANFFIFTRRHNDIRMAVKYLFLCKELTEVAALNAVTGNNGTR